MGIVSGYQVIVISKCISYSQARLSSLVVCVANMIMMSFGVVFHKLIGVVLDHFWAGGLVDGVRVYSKIAWIFAIGYNTCRGLYILCWDKYIFSLSV